MTYYESIFSGLIWEICDYPAFSLHNLKIPLNARLYDVIPIIGNPVVTSMNS
jgi:hypothetical protein